MEVADNGVGIPPENLVKIFFREFNPHKNGHGLALHYASLAAKQMGGTLTVQSEGLKKGAIFVLELPLRHAPTPGNAIQP
jgi:signal transduction histidine kinase